MSDNNSITKQTEKRSEKNASRDNIASALSNPQQEIVNQGKRGTRHNFRSGLISNRETIPSKTLEKRFLDKKSKADDENVARKSLSQSPNYESKFKKQLSLELNLDEILNDVREGDRKYLNDSKRNEDDQTGVLKSKGGLQLHKRQKRNESSKGSTDHSVIRTSENLENGKKRTVTKIRLLRNEELDAFDVSKLNDYERRTLLEHIEKEQKKKREKSNGESHCSEESKTEKQLCKKPKYGNDIELDEIEIESTSKEQEGFKVKNKVHEGEEGRKKDEKNLDNALKHRSESVEISPDGSVKRISYQLNNGTKKTLTKIRILKDENLKKDVEKLSENEKREFLKKVENTPTHKATANRLSAFLRESIEKSTIHSFKVTSKESVDEGKRNNNPNIAQRNRKFEHISAEIDNQSQSASEILDGEHEHGSLRRRRSKQS